MLEKDDRALVPLCNGTFTYVTSVNCNLYLLLMHTTSFLCESSENEDANAS